MKITIKYESEKLLPAVIYEGFEDAKIDLAKICREPDKLICLMDSLRYNIITWIAYHSIMQD